MKVACFDRATVGVDTLAQLNAFCVVDAAGPFQDGDLHFARVVLEAGCHYVDLADARLFLQRFSTLDDLAKRKGLAAVSGASSTPALSMAALSSLTTHWRRVDSVETAIYPSGRATLGASVVRAILSYAGQPIRVLCFGRWGTEPGWGLLSRRHVTGLGNRFLSLVETPDLDLVSERYPSVRRNLFFAGVELSVMHLGLWCLSQLVRYRAVTSLLALASPLHALVSLLSRLGSDTGGMTVAATGVDSGGKYVRAEWAMIARSGDGPQVPALPALCVVRGLVLGSISTRGAIACVDVVPLADMEAQFLRFAISSHQNVIALKPEALFKRIGVGFEAMPIAVQTVHSPEPASEMNGEVDVKAGSNWLSRLVARVAGFPVRDSICAAEVTIDRCGEEEVWIRRFGDHSFQSYLSAGSDQGLVCEKFGPISISMMLNMDYTGFSLSIVGWSIWGLPLPRFLAPTTTAQASSDSEGRYRFDTLINWPPVGRLVHYRGWLVPATLAR